MPVYRIPGRQPQPEPGSPDPEHLVCGLAASLGDWQPHQFTRFLVWMDSGRDGEPLPPLRLDHQRDMIAPSGMEAANVGECLRFASVPTSHGFPGGLLVLGRLFPAYARGILGDMHARSRWLAMSVGGVEHGLRDERGDLWIGEVSLVDKVGNQLDPDALVVGTGRSAVTAWELLTGGLPPYELLRSVG